MMHDNLHRIAVIVFALCAISATAYCAEHRMAYIVSSNYGS